MWKWRNVLLASQHVPCGGCSSNSDCYEGDSLHDYDDDDDGDDDDYDDEDDDEEDDEDEFIGLMQN